MRQREQALSVMPAQSLLTQTNQSTDLSHDTSLGSSGAECMPGAHDFHRVGPAGPAPADGVLARHLRGRCLTHAGPLPSQLCRVSAPSACRITSESAGLKRITDTRVDSVVLLLGAAVWREVQDLATVC